MPTNVSVLLILPTTHRTLPRGFLPKETLIRRCAMSRIVVALTLFLVLVGCSSEKKNAVKGTWRSDLMYIG